MFHLFKKKEESRPYLEVIANDIHCHLLPGVDDGSKSLEESIACMRVMQEVGLKTITITPHFCFPRYPNEETDIEARYKKFKEMLAEKAPDLELQVVGIGGEYRVDDGLEKKMEENKAMLHTARGKALLVELSLHQPRMGIDETLFDLQMKGEDLILAHPERYPYYNVKSELLPRLKEQGVMFQVNILSLSGFYGEGAQKRAISYIEEGWVEYLGTDLHNTLYARALVEAGNNKKVQKVLSKYTFKNSEL